MISIETIKENIDRNGYYICTVLQGLCPRFSYTVGLYEKAGHELAIAGLSLIDSPFIPGLIDRVVRGEREFFVEPDQNFAISLVDAHPAWLTMMARWVLRYYPDEQVKIKQVAFSEKNTIDTPNMRYPPNHKTNRSWKYLVEKWYYPIPESSEIYCDSGVLFGENILSISRYEEDYWEVSSGIEFDNSSKILPAAVIIERYNLESEIIAMGINTTISF